MIRPAVRFLPEAVEDLLETQRWYGRLGPAVAAAHLNAPLLGETAGGTGGEGTQASQAAMSARDRLRPAPLPGVPTSSGGKVMV